MTVPEAMQLVKNWVRQLSTVEILDLDAKEIDEKKF